MKWLAKSLNIVRGGASLLKVTRVVPSGYIIERTWSGEGHKETRFCKTTVHVRLIRIDQSLSLHRFTSLSGGSPIGTGTRASTATRLSSKLTVHFDHFPFGPESVFMRRTYASTNTVSFFSIFVASTISFSIRDHGSKCSVASYACLNTIRSLLRRLVLTKLFAGGAMKKPVIRVRCILHSLTRSWTGPFILQVAGYLQMCF